MTKYQEKINKGKNETTTTDHTLIMRRTIQIERLKTRIVK